MALGYYQLKKVVKFSFTLKAANNAVILTSQAYETKEAAKAGIASVQTNGPITERFEKKTSSAKEPYFVLKAANGLVIGTSEMYGSESARDNGIKSVQTNSPTTEVKDLTAKPII